MAKLFRDLELAMPKTRKPVNLVPEGFPESRAFIEDDSSLVASLCTRRAAKTYSYGLKALKKLQETPGASGLYLALTRDEAERIFWEPVIKDINANFGLGLQFNNSKLIARLANGSRLYLLGADSNEDEKRKILGQKYAIAGIDEVQAFRTDVRPLVYDILKPAVADYMGQICLMGTPGILAKGLFYDLTKGQNPMKPGRWNVSGWSGHRWSAFQNPHIVKNWRRQIDELKRTHPGIESTPAFRRNYLGEWIVEDSALVYRYVAGRNDYRELPRYPRGEWRYVLGCDLGHEDATAWVVCAYHDHDKTLWIVEAQKEKGLDITQVARRTHALRQKYDFDVMVIDGANKQAVEEMRNRHQLPWQAADKTGKEDFIDLMNGDFIMGRIRLGPNAEPVREEYGSLIWDERKLRETGKRTEHQACDNHGADAALYAWRWCYQYLSEKPEPAAESRILQYQEPDELEELEVSRFEAGQAEKVGVGNSSDWDETWRWR